MFLYPYRRAVATASRIHQPVPAKKTYKRKKKQAELPERPRLSKSHQFKPGNSLASNRGPNKITQDLKQGIVAAAAEIGYDGNGLGGLQGYLKYLGEDYPKQFVSLLGRVIPLQVNAQPGMYIGAVNIVGVPADRYLSAEQIKALQPPDEPPIIDGVQVIEAAINDGNDEEAA